VVVGQPLSPSRERPRIECFHRRLYDTRRLEVFP
jgi:hypothetical protein